MAAKIREITPADRLYHELYQLRRNLDQLLAEYEASTCATDDAYRPEVVSFRAQFKQEQNQTRDRSGRPKRISLIPSRV
jgi:hypothetical protein